MVWLRVGGNNRSPVSPEDIITPLSLSNANTSAPDSAAFTDRLLPSSISATCSGVKLLCPAALRGGDTGRRDTLRDALREAVLDTGVVGLDAALGVVARDVGREDREVVLITVGVTALLPSTALEGILLSWVIMDEARP